MIDLCAYSEIEKNKMFGWYDTHNEIVGISLTSDTPRYDIQDCIKENADDVLNTEYDNECVVYVYKRETIENKLKNKKFGEKFEYFINNLLVTNHIIFYIECF